MWPGRPKGHEQAVTEMANDLVRSGATGLQTLWSVVVRFGMVMVELTRVADVRPGTF